MNFTAEQTLDKEYQQKKNLQMNYLNQNQDHHQKSDYHNRSYQ